MIHKHWCKSCGARIELGDNGYCSLSGCIEEGRMLAVLGVGGLGSSTKEHLATRLEGAYPCLRGTQVWETIRYLLKVWPYAIASGQLQDDVWMLTRRESAVRAGEARIAGEYPASAEFIEWLRDTKGGLMSLGTGPIVLWRHALRDWRGGPVTTRSAQPIQTTYDLKSLGKPIDVSELRRGPIESQCTVDGSVMQGAETFSFMNANFPIMQEFKDREPDRVAEVFAEALKRGLAAASRGDV
jgi:hypothetical protein